ncbi:CLUMA_CG017516, isoform A [Clunio marinus]|uniref:CLUMA_CG017516, isoform A n=1 Tax=Clunio marinus TaxID=568069 RepID=A0A1J1IW85_9DIPT|nr:CLUMA_CG017516, isoform A [Clunio marinus]
MKENEKENENEFRKQVFRDISSPFNLVALETISCQHEKSAQKHLTVTHANITMLQSQAFTFNIVIQI